MHGMYLSISLRPHLSVFFKFLYVYLSSNWKNGVDKGLLSYAGSILMFLANDNNKYS